MVNIRIANIRDAAAITHISKTVAMEFNVPEFSEEGKNHFIPSLTVEHTLDKLQGDFTYWVAEKVDQAIGYIAFKGASHLYNLFVLKEFQRQGVAKMLWLYAKSAALAANNLDRITVNASTYSVPVYDRFGFSAIGAKQQYKGFVFTPMVLLLK